MITIPLSVSQCPPCRAFTPELVKTYNTLQAAGEPFEIIFCSSDRDEDSMKSYYDTMPWAALPFDDDRIKSLNQHFEIDGIPALVMLDKDNNTINLETRAYIAEDPQGKVGLHQYKTVLLHTHTGTYTYTDTNKDVLM